MAEIATGQWNVHWPKLKPGRNSHRAGSADTSPAKRERRPAPGEQTSFMTPPFRLPSRIGHRPSGYGTHALQPLVGSLTLASRGPVAVLAERPPPGERPTVLGEGPSGVGGMERPFPPLPTLPTPLHPRRGFPDVGIARPRCSPCREASPRGATDCAWRGAVWRWRHGTPFTPPSHPPDPRGSPSWVP